MFKDLPLFLWFFLVKFFWKLFFKEIFSPLYSYQHHLLWAFEFQISYLLFDIDFNLNLNLNHYLSEFEIPAYLFISLRFHLLHFYNRRIALIFICLILFIPPISPDLQHTFIIQLICYHHNSSFWTPRIKQTFINLQVWLPFYF